MTNSCPPRRVADSLGCGIEGPDGAEDGCAADQSLSRLAIAAGWELLLSFRQCAASGRCGAGLYNNRPGAPCGAGGPLGARHANSLRSEEHTSELQSLMRISYAVFCLKKKKK